MFGLIWVILWAVAIYNFYIADSSLILVSIIFGVLNFWSFGILYNFRHDTYTPHFWGIINFLTSIASIVFVIIAIFF
ncbi:hypothetical protein [Peribacillus sp. SCS-37]|uniref:hypothetical protein n=1 Tax=Paraperibacillus esterisolvens TaxID=3115296 RepID=UPI00390647F0